MSLVQEAPISSPTEGAFQGDDFHYAPIPVLVPISLGFIFLSLLAALTAELLLVPIVGATIAFLAIRQIQKSMGNLSGARIAWCSSAGLGRAVTSWASGQAAWRSASKGGADIHPAWYLNMLGGSPVAFQIGGQAFEANWREPEGAEHDEGREGDRRGDLRGADELPDREERHQLGHADGDAIAFYRRPTRRCAPDTEFDASGLAMLPRVDIAYAYAGCDGTAVRAFVTKTTSAARNVAAVSAVLSSPPAMALASAHGKPAASTEVASRSRESRVPTTPPMVRTA